MRTRTSFSLIEFLETRTLLSSVQPVGSEFALGGTPWSPDLNSGYGTYFGQQVATDAAGNILAKWVDPATKTVFLQSFHANGTPRTAPFNTGVPDTTLNENIDLSDDGSTAAMVWMANNTQKSYKSAHADSGQVFGISPIAPDPVTGVDARITAKTSAFTIAPKTTVSIGNPYVAMDYAGNFVIAWPRSAVDAIHAQQYTNSGALSGPEIGGIVTLSGGHNFMSVAMNRTPGVKGNFVITWDTAGHDNSDGSFGIYGQVFRNGSAISKSENLLNQNTLGNQAASRVAMTPVGGFIASWIGPDADGYGTYIRRFDSSARPLGDDILVNDDPTGQQGRIRLVAGDSGDFMVVWETGDFTGNGQATVYGQAFLADGTRAGSNFIVGTNDGLYLDVAAQPNDSFAVIWGDHYIGQTWGEQYQILA